MKRRQRFTIAASVAAVGLSLAIGMCAAAAAPGSPAALTGIGAAPDGEGLQIFVALSGPFQYLVRLEPGRIVIELDGVTAPAAVHPIALWPITRITVRRDRARALHVDVVVAVRAPLEIHESYIEDHVLLVRLGPAGTARMVPQGPGARTRGATHDTPAPGAGGRAAPPAAPASGTPVSAAAGGPAADDGLPPSIAGRTTVRRALRLEQGSGRLIQIDGLVRVAVGDPAVVGTVPVTGRELLVTGRRAGHTSMYVWEGPGRLLVYSVEVVGSGERLGALRRLLAGLFPSAQITVTELPPQAQGPAGYAASSPPTSRAATSPPLSSLGGRPTTQGDMFAPGGVGAPGGLERTWGIAAFDSPAFLGPPAGPGASPVSFAGTLPGSPAPAAMPGAVLSGSVETQLERERIDMIARAVAPVVIDLLTVRRPVQLTLQVTVAEMDRTALDALGVTWGGGQQVPGSPPSLAGGVYNLQVITSPGVSASGLDLLIAQLQAQAQLGRARLLAKPSLVVLAGRTASLLLGGQVPIPVAGANGTVTIDYKDFGVILSARPEVQDDGRLFLSVAPEVSTLDFTDAIRISGFTVPALRVRRAQTVVSMRPSDTLVLGGLLQHQDSELVQKIPLLGDLPVIGPLFRSRSFQHQETDLVIFVTPLLARGDGGAAPSIPQRRLSDATPSDHGGMPPSNPPGPGAQP